MAQASLVVWVPKDNAPEHVKVWYIIFQLDKSQVHAHAENKARRTIMPKNKINVFRHAVDFLWIDKITKFVFPTHVLLFVVEDMARNVLKPFMNDLISINLNDRTMPWSGEKGVYLHLLLRERGQGEQERTEIKLWTNWCPTSPLARRQLRWPTGLDA